MSYATDRLAFLSMLGMGLDAKRTTAWASYGYPDNLTFAQYRTAYERTGAGHGAVHRILDKCWQDYPRIFEGEEVADDKRKPTDFERAASALLRDPELMTFQRLVDFDRRNMVGRYSALILQVADGKQWREPAKKGKLIRLIPAFEDQIRVVEWVLDTASQQYGQPAMYQFRTREDRSEDTQGQPDQWVDIHPSRIIIMAEGSSYGMFEGVPLLRAGYNALVDLEKTQGGAAEAFLKNASRQLSIEFDPDASVEDAVRNGGGEGEGVADILNDQVNALNRNIDAAMVTQGAKVQSLQSQMSDPEPSWAIAANTFAASVQLPFTILFGQQTGRLASDQDQKDYAARCKSRQVMELTPMLYEFIRRMMAIGMLPTVTKFGIEWPDLNAMSDQQKLDNAAKLATINKECAAAGLTPAFEENELRVAAGYEKRDDYEGLSREVPQSDAASEQEQSDADGAAAQASQQ